MIIFSSIYDVLRRKYDVYDVTVNPFTGNGGVIYPRVVLFAKYRLFLS